MFLPDMCARGDKYYLLRKYGINCEAELNLTSCKCDKTFYEFLMHAKCIPITIATYLCAVGIIIFFQNASPFYFFSIPGMYLAFLESFEAVI